MTLDDPRQKDPMVPQVLIAARIYAEAGFWNHAVAERHPDAVITMTTFRRGSEAFRGHRWKAIYIVGSADQTGADFEIRDAFLREAKAASIRDGTLIAGQAALEQIAETIRTTLP